MSEFSKGFKRFWSAFYLVGCLLIIAIHTFVLSGCVEVGGGTSTSGSDVCTGTECGTHDESDNSTDNSDSSSS